MQDGQPGPRAFHPDLVPPQEPAEPVEPEAVNPPEPEVVKRFVGGRERTLDEIVAGYDASEREALKLRAELEAERRIRQALETAPRAPEPALVSDDGDVEEARLREFISRQAEQAARTLLQQALEPLAKAEEAALDMKRANPDFDRGRMQEHLAASPADAEIFNRLNALDPRGALEFGWRAVQAAKTQSAADSAGARGAAAPTARRAPSPNTRETRTKNLQKLLEQAESGEISWDKYYGERLRGTSADRFGDAS